MPLSRPAYALAVTVGAAVATFGFLAVVVLGLIVGASAAGRLGGFVVAIATGFGWVHVARRAWRRIQRWAPT